MSAAKGNFLKEHWDWLVAGAGVAALGAAVALCIGGLGASAESAAEGRQAELNARHPKNEGVKEVDTEPFDAVSRLAQKPPETRDGNLQGASFLASAARYACRPGAFELKPKLSAEGEPEKGADGKPVMTLVPTADGKHYAQGKDGPVPLSKDCGGLPIIWSDATNVCPFCHAYQYRDPQAIEKNEDADGLDKAWKRKYGFAIGKDVSKDDPDGDGFTNEEEYAAKTDPKDGASHPDYLDSIALQGDIRRTYLPFYPSVANKVPDGKGGWTYRLTLPRLDAKKFEDTQFSVKVGDPVSMKSGKKMIDTGFVLTSFTPKTEQKKIAGSNAKRSVDVSEAVFTRKADGKKIPAPINVKKVPVDREATLRFSRGEGETFKVRAGDKIKIMKRTYEVVSLEGEGPKAKVTLKDVASGRTRAIGGATTASSGLD